VITAGKQTDQFSKVPDFTFGIGAVSITSSNRFVDAFNALNHATFMSYIGTLRLPFFGEAVSAYPLRRLQLSLRFKF
jgi:hypothetical protein